MEKGKKIQINGVNVNAEKELIGNKTLGLAVHAGSTGLCGGDRRAGGRTYVSLEGLGTIDLIVTLIAGKDGTGTGFEIAASGDTELVALAKAFYIIAKKLMESITKDCGETEYE